MGNSFFKNSYFTVLIASFLLSINLLQAQTNVSGNITTNTTWTKAASPYNLTSNVIVDNGATLTIEPGVVVEAKGHIYLSVLGKIIAVGTETDSIYFKGNGVKGFWTGIKIRNTGGSVLNADYTYASGSKFSYVSVADADLGFYYFNCGLYVTNTTFNNNKICIENRATTKSIVRNCDFKNNDIGGYVGSVAPLILNNNPLDNLGSITDLKYENCNFFNNNEGIEINYQSTGTFDGLNIYNCVFNTNNTGVAFGGPGEGYYVTYVSNFIVSNNIFNSNKTALNIVKSASANSRVFNNIFNNNYDYAIYTNYQGNVNVSNNIFSKNKVSIRNFGPPCVLNNNYYKDNYLNIELGNNFNGGGLSSVEIKNSIFDDRKALSLSPIIKFYSSVSNGVYNIELNTFNGNDKPILDFTSINTTCTFNSNYIVNKNDNVDWFLSDHFGLITTFEFI